MQLFKRIGFRLYVSPDAYRQGYRSGPIDTDDFWLQGPIKARSHSWSDRVPASGVARHWPDGIGQAELISSPVPQAS